jgi:hypothetical protein
MTIRWHGLVAPEEAATGDRRMFASQALTYRDFPLPAGWQRVTSSKHAGSVIVASWDAQFAGDGGIWGRGEFLDPRIVPEVVEAVYLLDKGLIGPSVDLDPDMAYEVVPHPNRPDEDFAIKVTRANVHALTFVMGPAFPQVHITVDDDEEMTILASAGVEHVTFAVNKSSWRSWPVAPRETEFTFDEAIARIAEWSGGDPSRFGQAFLHQDKSLPPTSRESYRLPIADIHNSRLTLIPRAVFSAGTFLSNGHGGLETVPAAEITQLQEVITEIYDMLRETYADPRVIAPWQRGGRAGATSAEAKPTTTAGLDAMETFQSRLTGPLHDYWIKGEGAAKIRWGTEGSFDRCVRALRDKFPRDTEGLCANLHHEATGKWPAEGKHHSEHSVEGAGIMFINSDEDSTFAVRSGGWDSMPTSTGAWDEGAARSALDAWAGDSIEKYGRAFLWTDGSGNKTGFKFPIAKPVNGTLTIFIRAVNNADARLSQANIPAADKARIQAILDRIQKRYQGSENEASMDAVTAAGVLYPPKSAFADPKLTKPTPLTITDDGRVFGHFALWRKCHQGVGNKCVMAPRSATNYKHFKLGSVKCDDGTVIPVGKITLGTGHADKSFGLIPAIEHYDHTGTCVAVVNAGEDRFGPWLAGALVAGVSEERIAELRRSPLSGDWRRTDGNLELCAALAVNSPGFPVLHQDGDEVVSLTAAGMLENAQGHEVEHVNIFNDVDIFLNAADRAHRASVVTQAFQDLLPSDDSCGCAA